MRRLALLLALGTACTVPTLAQLEEQQPRGCDGAHLCADGYTCLSGVCRPKTSGECINAQTQACGSDVGECDLGLQTCADGKWGTCVGEIAASAETCDGKDNDCDSQIDEGLVGDNCTPSIGVCAGAKQRCVGGAFELTCLAASFGPDYEAAVETKCDNKDNDCDGAIDESITQACPKDAGVCAGLKSSCAAGAFASCDALYPTALGYQPYELSCDGVDNDCDGKVDKWDPQNLSTSSAVGSKRPSATQLPSGPLLVLWEEGTKVVARGVNVDGTLKVPVTPSDSINVATRAFAPVVVSDANLTYAAWAEVVSGSLLRVMVAPLDANGRSTLTTSSLDGGVIPAAMPIVQSGTNLTALALALDVSANRIFVAAVVDTKLNLYAFPLVLPAVEVYSKLNQVTNPAGKVAVGSPSDGGVWFAVEQGISNDIRRCRIDATGGVRCAAPDQSGSDPQLGSSPSPGSAVFAFAQGPNALIQTCTSAATDAGCAASAPLLSSTSALGNLTVDFTGSGIPRMAAWVEGSLLKSAPLPFDGGVTTSSTSAMGARPRALTFGAQWSVVVTDLDATGGAVANEVVVLRQCGP